MHLERKSFNASTGEQSLSTQTKRFHNSTNLTNSICSAWGQAHQIYYVVAVVVVLLGRDAVEPVTGPADVLFIFIILFFAPPSLFYVSISTSVVCVDVIGRRQPGLQIKDFFTTHCLKDMFKCSIMGSCFHFFARNMKLRNILRYYFLAPTLWLQWHIYVSTSNLNLQQVLVFTRFIESHLPNKNVIL